MLSTEFEMKKMQKQKPPDNSFQIEKVTKCSQSLDRHTDLSDRSTREENLVEDQEKSLLSAHFKVFRIIFLPDTPAVQVQVLKEEARLFNVAWLVEQANIRVKSLAGDKFSKSSDLIQMLRTEARRIVYDYLLSIPSSTLDSFPDNIDLIPYTPIEPSRFSSPTSASSHVNIGDFYMYARIGKGGFSTVYVGRKRDTGKIYAIKQVKKGFSKNPQYENNSLINEKNIHLKLEDYMPGGNLRRLLREKAQFTEEQTKFFVAETLSDLAIMHDKCILYRDLKSENLLLDAKGHVHICDFGITKQLQPESPYLTSVCGTLEMMAPEVVKGEKYTFTADYYSLGVLAYELITGNPPFYNEQSRKDLVNCIKNVNPTFPSYLSPALEDFLKGLLTKDPSKRLGAKGYKEIMNHPWLADIDFAKVKKRAWPACFDLSDKFSELKFKKVYQINNESENDIVFTIPIGTGQTDSFAYSIDDKPLSIPKMRYFSALKEDKPNFSRFSSTSSQIARIPFMSEMMGQSFDTGTNIVTNVLFSESGTSNSRNSEYGQFRAFNTIKYLTNSLKQIKKKRIMKNQVFL